MSRFSTEFQAIPASAIMVGGCPAGLAASRQIPHEILSSLAGVFAVSADTARLIGDLIPRQAPLRRAA